MGLNFRKSFKVGPARINLSKSGVGYSVGAGGLRYTKRANRKKSREKSGCFSWLWKIILAVLAFCVVVEYFDVIAAVLIIAAIIAVAVFVGVKVHKAKKNAPQIETAGISDEADGDNQST